MFACDTLNSSDPVFLLSELRAYPQVVGEQRVCCWRNIATQQLHHALVPGDGLLQPKTGYAPVPGNPSYPTPDRYALLSGLQLLQSAVHAGVPVQSGRELWRLQIAQT